ncbi:MAG: hypothetical protein Kapaf2KO_03530 [Candidatus Kapaibacteriales bacterium]
MADTLQNEENQEFEGVRGEDHYIQDENETLDPKLKKAIAITIVAIVAIFGAVYAYSYMQEQNEEEKYEASARLVRVMQLVQSGDMDAALEGSGDNMRGGEPIMGYREIAEEYSGIEAGKTAALKAADILIGKGEFDEAEKYLNIAIDSDALITKLGANANLALIEENKENYSEAAALYAKASALSEATSLQQKFSYFAGLNYGMAGDNEKAGSSLNRSIKLSQGSQWANLSRLELARLGIKIDS